MSFRSIFSNVFGSPKTVKGNTEASRHAKRAFKKRFSFAETVFAIALVFLFLPLLVLIFYSFNESTSSNWTGLSLRWYRQLLGSRELWRALVNSVIIAVTSSVTAVIIGTLGAIGVNWYKFRLRGYVQTISFLPMILPEIIIGVSLAIFFAGAGIPPGMFTIYAAHTTFNLPFVFLLVMARLDEFDFSIIEAAADLGANEREILFKVTLPICMPGII
jgi:spermidine/putrescine transport system permease protein